MKKFLALVVIIIVLGALAILFMVAPPQSNGTPTKFTVVTGSGVHAISRNLKAAGLIRNQFAFETIIWLRKAGTRIRAGEYRLSTSDSAFKIVATLLAPPAKDAYRLTFIEGWRLTDYHQYLDDQLLDGDQFDSAVASAPAWKKDYSFLTDVPAGKTLEGYVFPDTYLVAIDFTMKDLVTKALNNFDSKVTSDMRDAASKQGRSLYDVVTLASILEKEVANSHDRALVADIFLKRLDAGIALQSDATVNYITRSGRSRSTNEDLAIDSPYNTYKYKGLPPGPISNPGLDAITASLNPEKNDYYYFLTDKDGAVHYAKTFKEHQKNREKYL